ncbi:MAG: transcription termination/antitermination protein NusA [Chlamydiia bacterium]|nr:transcription termination/antitermination protein NusA [Chlamydiia bacterium]
MNKDLTAVFDYLEREKGIKREIVIGAIEESLQAAARKSIEGASNVRVEIHPRTGNIVVYCEKEIVEEVEVPTLEISLEAARELDPDCELGQFIDVVVTPSDFGRIAAQKARQIITQKLRGAERDVIYEEYRHRVGELVSGTVKRFVRGPNMIIDLGKVEAILPGRNYPKTERYQVGDRVLALLQEVRDTENGGAEVVLSRSHPDYVRQLFDQEVPEIHDGTIVLDRVVRIAGYRTKLTVRSTDNKVDPVGACVGMRGSRVKNVVRELNNEKVDIIPFADEPVELLQNALSPIEIRKVRYDEEERTISIVVDDDDFATVIGRKGMNARLNGELLQVELDAQKMSDYHRSMALQRMQLAQSEDPKLDEPLETLPGVNALILENLIAEGFDTERKLLLVKPEELAAVPGISLDMADSILEQLRKERI